MKKTLLAIIIVFYFNLILTNQSVIEALDCATKVIENILQIENKNGCSFVPPQGPTKNLSFVSTINITQPPTQANGGSSSPGGSGSTSGSSSPSGSGSTSLNAKKPISLLGGALFSLGELVNGATALLSPTVVNDSVSIGQNSGVKCQLILGICLDTPALNVDGLIASIFPSKIKAKNFNLSATGILFVNNDTQIYSDDFNNVGGSILANATTSIYSGINMSSNASLNITGSDFTSYGVDSDNANINVDQTGKYITPNSTNLSNGARVNNYGSFQTSSFSINSNSKAYSEGNILTNLLKNIGGSLIGKNGQMKANSFISDSNNQFTGSSLSINSLNITNSATFNIANGDINTPNSNGVFSISGTVSIDNTTSNLSPQSMDISSDSEVNFSNSNVNINSQFQSSGTSKFYGNSCKVGMNGARHSLKDSSLLSFLNSNIGLASSSLLSLNDQSGIQLKQNTVINSGSVVNAADQSTLAVSQKSIFNHNGESMNFKDSSILLVSNSDILFNKPFSFSDQSKINTDTDSSLSMVGTKGTMSGKSKLSLLQSTLNIDPLSILNMTEQSIINLNNGSLSISGYLLQSAFSSILCNQSLVQLSSGEKQISGIFNILEGSSLLLSNNSRVSVSGNLSVSSSSMEIKNGQFDLQQNGQLTLNSGTLSNEDRLNILGKLIIGGNTVFNNLVGGTVKLYSSLTSDDNSNIIENFGQFHFMENTNNVIDQFINNGQAYFYGSKLSSNQFSIQTGHIDLNNSTISTGTLFIKGGSMFAAGSTVDGDLYHESGSLGSQNTTSTLNITGDCNQQINSNTNIYIDIDNNNQSISQIHVGKNMSFNGTLTIVLNQENIDKLASVGSITMMRYGSFSGNFSTVNIRVFNPSTGQQKDVDNKCITLDSGKTSMSMLVNSADSCTPTDDSVFSNTKSRTILMSTIVSVSIVLAISTAVLIWKRHSIATFLKIRRESRLMRQSINNSRF
ncbi:hypothetical protein PPL_09798 [Heterostelium album PN500]|uniref:Uncharacterized protein n=1 Tax=Heterostelium pallidum (strain ATCC 26659 / Pp 5 / PN500) TaxID=670386 RepID=D3BP35_HETP5|nr:hypothetical protein PPL_09798 [Heterostelium album PN500]EFA77045.1 hypothetical protein PPL_09798 [Heterostelium album PN500]|eukprot:XP_020429175.1 hypothetical protein PPL_09798 [Heterostelium album PN500]